jgi:hypothetical protein
MVDAVQLDHTMPQKKCDFSAQNGKKYGFLASLRSVKPGC